MSKDIFRRAVCLAFGIALSLAQAAAADTAGSSDQNGLGGSAGNGGGNSSGGDYHAVMIYRAPAEGSQRYCLTGDDDPLSSAGWGLYITKACDPLKPSHWFLLGAKGELRPKNDPAMCVSWVAFETAYDGRVRLQTCDEEIGDNQIFKLTASGRITDQGGTWCLTFTSGDIPTERLCETYQQTTESFRWAGEPEFYFKIRAADDGDHVIEHQPWVWSKAPERKMAQFWYTAPSSVKKDGKPTYFIIAADDHTCLHYTGHDGGTDTVPCRVDEEIDSDLNSRWQFTPNTDGTFVIQNAGSGQCANVSRGQRWGELITWGCHGGVNGNFYLDYASLGQNNVLLASADQTSNEENCIVPDYGGVKVARSVCGRVADALRAAVNFRPDGAIEFRATGMCLDLYSWRTDSGQWPCNTGSNQRWTARPIKVASGSITEDGAAPAHFPLYKHVGIESSADGSKFLQNRYASGNYDGHSVTAPLPPGETAASFSLRTASSETVAGTATWTIADLHFLDGCYDPPATRVKRSGSRDEASADVLRLRAAMSDFRVHVTALRARYPRIAAADLANNRDPERDLASYEEALTGTAADLLGPPARGDLPQEALEELQDVWLYVAYYYRDAVIAWGAPVGFPIEFQQMEEDMVRINAIVNRDLLERHNGLAGLKCFAPIYPRNNTGPAK